ncbi:MAG: hypothetical protein MUC60_08600 [Oscillatoria sp. Prado101]|nr:hypothetical protein [Oscillatoria sp. Prado101]
MKTALQLFCPEDLAIFGVPSQETRLLVLTGAAARLYTLSYLLKFTEKDIRIFTVARLMSFTDA